MLTDTTRSPYAKVHALDGMKVKWTGGLWKERFDTCASSTVPQLKHRRPLRRRPRRAAPADPPRR